MTEERETTKPAAAAENETETDWRRRFLEERDAFGRYRAAAEAREAGMKRQERLRRICAEAGLSPGRQAAILRLSGLTGEDGDPEEAETISALREAFSGEARTRGADVPTPPRGERTVTRSEILAIRDARARQAAIAENHELFGF